MMFLLFILCLSPHAEAAAAPVEVVKSFLRCGESADAEKAFHCRMEKIATNTKDWHKRRYASDPLTWKLDSGLVACGDSASPDVCGFIRLKTPGAHRKKIRFVLKGGRISSYRY